MKRHTYIALLLLPVMVLAGCAMPDVSLPSAAANLVPALVAAPQQQTDPSAASVLATLEETLEGIYVQVSPSVVNIQVLHESGGAVQGVPQIPGMPLDPSEPGQMPPQGGLGSGFVWDKEGHIVTNNHVVAGATKIKVIFADGVSAPAEVVGTDPYSDLAVVKVDLPADQLVPVQVADSTDVRVGNLAVAIGNPFGLEGTMTVGFVSALGRSLPVMSEGAVGSTYTIPGVIQTDAPINPGNSGGVLVNSEGRVIGVPTAIESPVEANAGIGFAVPSAIVQKVAPNLIKTGSHDHPWLGVSGTSLVAELAEAMDLEPSQRGVLIIDVVPGGPADEAGLRGSEEQTQIDGQEVRVGGDVVLAIEGQPVVDFEDLVAYLVGRSAVGETVTLTILRDGEQEHVKVTLAARPEQEEQARIEPDMPTVPTGAWLGIAGATVVPEIARAMDLAPDQQGVLVQQVVPSSPADRAGLRGGSGSVDINGQTVQVGGDVIVGVDDEPIAKFEDLVALMRQSQPGQEVTLRLLRDGEMTDVNVTLGSPSARSQ